MNKNQKRNYRKLKTKLIFLMDLVSIILGLILCICCITKTIIPSDANWALAINLVIAYGILPGGFLIMVGLADICEEGKSF